MDAGAFGSGCFDGAPKGMGADVASFAGFVERAQPRFFGATRDGAGEGGEEV